jgi:hypothetical protein
MFLFIFAGIQSISQRKLKINRLTHKTFKQLSHKNHEPGGSLEIIRRARAYPGLPDILMAGNSFPPDRRAPVPASRTFALASRPFLLASGTFAPASRPFLLASGTFALAGKSFLLASRTFALTSRPFLLADGTFVLAGKSFLPAGGTFVQTERSGENGRTNDKK